MGPPVYREPPASTLGLASPTPCFSWPGGARETDGSVEDTAQDCHECSSAPAAFPCSRAKHSCMLPSSAPSPNTHSTALTHHCRVHSASPHSAPWRASQSALGKELCQTPTPQHAARSSDPNPASPAASPSMLQAGTAPEGGPEQGTHCGYRHGQAVPGGFRAVPSCQGRAQRGTQGLGSPMNLTASHRKEA